MHDYCDKRRNSDTIDRGNSHFLKGLRFACRIELAQLRRNRPSLMPATGAPSEESMRDDVESGSWTL
jgi:hypothetical protein